MPSSPNAPSSNPPNPQTSEGDAFDFLERKSTDDLIEFLAMLQRMVPYSLFAARLPHAEYRRRFVLAALDLFSAFDEGEKKRRIGAEPEEVRAHALFPEIKGRVLTAGGLLAEDRTMDKAAKDFEEVMVREQARLAFTGRPADRPEAIASFLDRTSAKKGREPDPGKGLYLPEGFLEVVRLGFALAKGQLNDEVSAERLNTPKLAGAGETPDG